MYELFAWDLVKQQREQTLRLAERAQLVREARARRRRGERPQGR